MLALRKCAHLMECGGDVASVIFGVAKVQVGVVPRAACRPAIWVDLRQNAFQILERRILTDDRAPVLDIGENLLDCRRRLLAMLGIGAVSATFHMKGRKIDRRAWLAAVMVHTIRAVIEKRVEKDA